MHSYLSSEISEMLMDIKEELLARHDCTFAVCRFVSGNPGIQAMMNNDLGREEYEYASFVKLYEGDFALAVSRLTPSNGEPFATLGLVKVGKVFTGPYQHPAVGSKKTGFIIERLSFSETLQARLAETRDKARMKKQLLEQALKVKRNIEIETLAARDPELQQLLNAFKRRFPNAGALILEED